MPKARILKLGFAGAALAGLTACTVAGPAPGTVEYAAATVSRAYDCGLRVDRGRIIARIDRQERQRFVEANQRYAVSAYRAPHACGMAERERVRGEIVALARR
ncbi:hypothetical protein [Bosea sp. BH3]|uniref:hypothetical protein n=1 Tax=Bosea sp. BH3 TaxID=2871701 RepID=UPI0021CB77B9|nr:hypothetical protein [Bosea sp. BH3]MCU4180595.1 hypothetical protein [Bosea sp. BH3]